MLSIPPHRESIKKAFQEVVNQLIFNFQCRYAFEFIASNPNVLPLGEVYMMVIHAIDHELEVPSPLLQLLLLLDSHDGGYKTLVSIRNSGGITPTSFMVMTELMNAHKNRMLEQVLEVYPYAVNQRDFEGKTLVEAIVRRWVVLTTGHGEGGENRGREEEGGQVTLPGENGGTGLGGAQVAVQNNDVAYREEGRSEGVHIGDGIDDFEDEEERRGVLSGELEDALGQNLWPRAVSPRLAAFWGRVALVVKAYIRTRFPPQEESLNHLCMVLALCMCEVCPIPVTLLHLTILLSGGPVCSVNSRGESPLLALLRNPIYSLEASGNNVDGILVGHVRLLLASNPRLAEIPHGVEGRLPIHVALARKCSSQVVQVLYAAFPAAVGLPRDPVTKIYPFLLPLIVNACEAHGVVDAHAQIGPEMAIDTSATTRQNDLDTSYTVFRANPAVIAPDIANN